MIKTIKTMAKQEKERYNVPRKVQDVIPVRRIWPDGIFLVGTKFTKTYKFTDINYLVASREDKESMFLIYSELLNSLDSGAVTKITVNNRRMNKANFEQSILMPMQGDFRDEYRREYNQMLLDKATGANGIMQEKYITISVVKKDIEEARAYFARVGADLVSHFAALGSKCVELDATERLRILHDFYRQGEEAEFRFNAREMMKRGHDFRDYICPDGIEKNSDYLKLGEKYCRVLFLKDYASYIKDNMVTELTDFNRNMMLSIDVVPVPTDEAVREVENRLLGVETNITNWQRRQNANNNFSAVVPYDMELQRKESKEFLDDLTTRDQRMMFAVITLAITADTPFVKSKCTKKQKYFLGGQNEGDFFPEKLLGAQITEHFAGVVVQPVLDPLGLLVGDRAQVGALRQVPTYEAVLVLIGSALARPVGVAVVDLGAGALAAGASFDPGGVCELAAIVAGDGSEYLREQVAVLGLEPVNRSDDAGGRLVRRRYNELPARFPLGHHDVGVADALAAFDAVHLPVSEGAAVVDVLGAILDAPAGRLAGHGSGRALWLLALAVLRQHGDGQLVAEDLAADVVVGGARADVGLEGPALDLSLTDRGLRAVLLVADLGDQVVGQLVVVADLQLRALGAEVCLISSLRTIGVVRGFGGVVAVSVLIGASLQLAVYRRVMHAELLGDVRRLHSRADEGVELDALGRRQMAPVLSHCVPLRDKRKGAARRPPLLCVSVPRTFSGARASPRL